MTNFTGLTHRRHRCAALLLLVLLAPWPAEAAVKPEMQEEQTIWIYKQVVPATVFLTSSYVASPVTNTAAGTGFILDETGIVVSNAHVVSGAHHVAATLYDGQRVKVEVLGTITPMSRSLGSQGSQASFRPCGSGPRRSCRSASGRSSSEIPMALGSD